MGFRARGLPAKEIKVLRHSGRSANPELVAVGDPAGLYVQVRPGGSRSWIFRYRLRGRSRYMGLGPYPVVSLKTARELASKARLEIVLGTDPLLERRSRRALSFREAALEYFKVKSDELSSKAAQGWRQSLEDHAFPALGDRLVAAEIDVQDVLRCLEPLWRDKIDVGRRLRGRNEAVLAWAIVSGHRKGDNPVRWRRNLDAVLAKPGKVAKRDAHPAVAQVDLPAWFRRIRETEGFAARARELLALTEVRSGEVRGARWDEFHLGAGLWVIPAARMKAGEEHRVALSADAVALLRALPRLGDLVFPGTGRGTIASETLRRAMGAASEGLRDLRSKRTPVVHGLRSSFRDWAAEAGVDRDLAEVSLAHALGSAVERSYRRTDMLELRRVVMERWAAALRGDSVGDGARVAPFRR